MRLATFNLLHGLSLTQLEANPDAIADAAGLAESMRLLDADVVALQEVDAYQPRSSHQHQAQLAAEAMDAQTCVFVPTVAGTPGGADGFRSTTEQERRAAATGEFVERQYGIALLSRRPVLEHEVHIFEPPRASLPLLVQSGEGPRMTKVRDEQRAAIVAVIDGEHGPFTVVAAHLSFVPGVNVRQLRAIKALTSDLPRPLFLMGDLNIPWDLARRVARWKAIHRGPTYPSYKPRIQFDHLLVDELGERQLDAFRRSARSLRLPVSDHQAVIADGPL